MGLGFFLWGLWGGANEWPREKRMGNGQTDGQTDRHCNSLTVKNIVGHALGVDAPPCERVPSKIKLKQMETDGRKYGGTYRRIFGQQLESLL